MKKGNIVTIVLVSIIIALVIGISYAWYTWISDKKKLTGESECFEILYAKGENIGSDQELAVLMPSSTYTGGLSSTFKFNFSNKCSDISAKGILSIQTLDTTSENLYEPGLLNYQLLINGEVTNIKGNITSSGEIPINLGKLNRAIVATDTYTLYVWIDYNLVKNKHAYSNYYGKIKVEAIQMGV